MKRLFQATLLLSVALLVGCWQFRASDVQTTTTTTTTTETFWLNYYLTQCNDNPWESATATPRTTTEQAVADYYQTTYDITIFAVEVTPPQPGILTCQACGCPTGTVVSVQVDATGREALLEAGFTEDDVADELGADALREDTTATVSIAKMVPSTLAPTTDDDVAEVTVVIPEDQTLQERVDTVQQVLAEYYQQYGDYPATLADLSVAIDSTGITYTPIGSLPADYYDLSVEYSTGKVVLNP